MQAAALTPDAKLGPGVRAGVSFSATSLTVSGFETFGEQPVRHSQSLFSLLWRNQDKYQVRYDVSHIAGTHAFKFGVNFIHEPVLSGHSRPGRDLYSVCQRPDLLRTKSGRVLLQSTVRGGTPADGSTCTYTPAAMAALRRTCRTWAVRAGLVGLRAT